MLVGVGACRIASSLARDLCHQCGKPRYSTQTGRIHISLTSNEHLVLATVEKFSLNSINVLHLFDQSPADHHCTFGTRCSNVSIACWNIAGAAATPKGNRQYWNSPKWVFTVQIPHPAKSASMLLTNPA